MKNNTFDKIILSYRNYNYYNYQSSQPLSIEMSDIKIQNE